MVILEFRSTFATNEQRIVSGMAFNCYVAGKPIDPIHVNKTRFNRISGDITIKGIHDINVRSSGAKVKQISQMTVFQEMGVESNLPNQIFWAWYHSLLRKMLYLMVYLSNGCIQNIQHFLLAMYWKIHRSSFFGTPGIVRK